MLEVLAALNVVYKNKGKKRRNPNELIYFILNRLHKELNTNNKNNILKPNIHDKNDVIKKESNNFINSNKSQISQLLNWFEIKETKCNNVQCYCRMYNLYSFNTFELDIIQSQNQMNSHINIYDCLQYFQKEKKQKLYCKLCNNYSTMSISSRIFSSPYMFIFSLNRGDLTNTELLRIRFVLEEKIDLSIFIELENVPRIYELTAIVSITTYKNDFIYVSFCKSPVDNHWYYYNDQIIKKVEINDVINYHNNNNQYIPCILAYKAIENK